MIISAGLFVMILVMPGYAQDYSMNRGQFVHDEKERPTLQVRLDPKPDPVKEAWKDFIKDEFNVKLKGIGFLSNKDLMSAEKVQMKALSDKELNFYTHVVENDGRTEMNVFVSLGYDIYVEPKEYPDMYGTMETITRRFLSQFLPQYYQKQLSETKDRLSDLRDERSDLKDNIEDNKKDIEDLREDNEDLRAKLSEKEQAIAKAEQMVNQRQQAVKTAENATSSRK